jgi:hypothetical protein
MVAGMMSATVVSGQVTSRTGKYKIFMVLGTGLLMAGYISLFGYHYDTPIWVLSISMVVIGMGLGQLMQTLTLAAQNAVEARDIGVATSSSMFFRQMGGTLGVAVFISILFNRLPDALKESLGNQKIQDGINSAASDASLPQDQAMLAQGLKAAIQDPSLLDKMTGSVDLSKDSSFINVIDDRLAAPFKFGFASASVTVFIAAAAVVAIAFAMSWFIKAPALRDKSAAAEAASSSAH